MPQLVSVSQERLGTPVPLKLPVLHAQQSAPRRAPRDTRTRGCVTSIWQRSVISILRLQG
jgi:hypothetical protein